MTDPLELDALWEEFHRVVNMTSQELAAWLRVRDTGGDTGGDTEPLPEHAGTPTGQHVLAILQKRRTDLTDDDVRVMYEVVDAVEDDAVEDDAVEDAAEGAEQQRRHRLMTLGHDPLRATP